MARLPIAKVKKPSTLAGLDNGKLPDSALAYLNVPNINGVGQALMEKTAVRAFEAMFAAARRDLGVEIREVGDYRSYDAQLNLFLSRYKPVSYEIYASTSRGRRKYWNKAQSQGYSSNYWVKKASWYATAATPGNSNHGWGLALDIAEEYDSDDRADPISSRFVNWLINNASTYGISAELQSEVWHWRYHAGDSIPQAVLDYEAGNPPPVIQPPQGKQIIVQVTREKVRQGDSGVMVTRVQSLLTGVFGLEEIVGGIDGQFGPRTDMGVKEFQRKMNLEVDGICGPNTWNALENLTP